MKLAEKLKYYRKRIGYKLLDVSKASGIRYSDLCRFERGTKTPKFSQLVKLADIYKTSTDNLLSQKKPVESKMIWCK